MAQSPAHKFGQIIGDTLEAGIIPLLEQFARVHDLYFDRKGSRACRSGKKCSWIDADGNSHDLDFVLERGGTSENVGTPAAFIEVAWRRYTKHSRNKAQEIQGAIEPLARTYQAVKPFKGVVLAGDFTAASIQQLRSLGFVVLHISYTDVVEAFSRFGIDAAFDEDTPDRAFESKARKFARLSRSRRSELANALFAARTADVTAFLKALEAAVSRQLDRIIVIALHGSAHESILVEDAIKFVTGYRDNGAKKPLERIEIILRYNNGDEIKGSFQAQNEAVAFLRGFEPVPRKVN